MSDTVDSSRSTRDRIAERDDPPAFQPNAERREGRRVRDASAPLQDSRDQSERVQKLSRAVRRDFERAPRAGLSTKGKLTPPRVLFDEPGYEWLAGIGLPSYS